MAKTLFVPARRHPIRVDFITTDVELAHELHQRTERLEILGIPSTVYLQDLLDWEPKVRSFLVAPGNSFGHMTGGFDEAITVKFAALKTVEETVQDNIMKGHGGELPVGMATLILFEHMKWAGLIYSPTMRVPHVIPDGSDAPYVATRAALLMFSQYMQPKSPWPQNPKADATNERGLVFTGMGSGTGEVPPAIAAEQMILAIERHFLKQPIRDLMADGLDLHKQLTYWSRG